MGITERNPGALDALRERVRLVSSPAFSAERSQLLASAATKQVADCLRESRDPYGAAYKPLTSRDGVPLRGPTGQLFNSTHPVQTGGGFEIVIDAHHPKTHNYGAVIKAKTARALFFMVRGVKVFAQKVTIPKRQIVPDSARGLGPIWSKAFADEDAALMKRTLRAG